MMDIIKRFFDNGRQIYKFLTFKGLKNFKDAPVELQIETTSLCNAKCWFCPNQNLKRKRMCMKDNTFMTIIKRLKDEKINVERFILHLNGEPLSDPKLFERIEILHKNFPASQIRFTTNFSLATEEIIQKIIYSPLNEITISLNTLDKREYFSLMGLSYSSTINNINDFIHKKNILNSNIIVNFSIVSRPDNYNIVEEFKKTYNQYGNVRIIRLGKWINSEETVPSEMNNLIQTSKICPILYKTINILSNGNYSLCCFDAEGIVPLNVIDTSIRKAWRSKYFNRIRFHHLQYGKTNIECYNCSFK